MSTDVIGRRRAVEERLARARSLAQTLNEATANLAASAGQAIDDLDPDGSLRTALNALAGVAALRPAFDVIVALPGAAFALRVQHVDNDVEIEVLYRDGPDEPPQVVALLEQPGEVPPDRETPGQASPGSESPGSESPGSESPGSESPAPESSAPESSGLEPSSPESSGPESPGLISPSPESPSSEPPSLESPSPELASHEAPSPGILTTAIPSQGIPGQEPPGQAFPRRGTASQESPSEETPDEDPSAPGQVAFDLAAMLWQHVDQPES